MKMKIYSFVFIGLAVMIPTSSFADYKRINNADSFTAQVVGKKITFEGGNAIIHANGKTNGRLNKKGKYRGAWVWRNGFYCRNLIIENKETGTKCLKVEIDGVKLRMTMDKGKGRVTEATMK